MPEYLSVNRNTAGYEMNRRDFSEGQEQTMPARRPSAFEAEQPDSPQAALALDALRDNIARIHEQNLTT